MLDLKRLAGLPFQFGLTVLLPQITAAVATGQAKI